MAPCPLRDQSLQDHHTQNPGPLEEKEHQQPPAPYLQTQITTLI